MIARYPGRSLSVHLKEHGGPERCSGRVLSTSSALTLCEQVGTTCYVIEHESDPEHAFEAARSA